MGRLGNRSLLIFSSILCVLLLSQCQKKSKTSKASGPNCDGSALTEESSDPFYSLQWHLDNSGGGSVSDLNLGNVWDTNKGTDVRVNVVDDGLEVLHEDLATNVLTDGGYNFWVGYSGFSTSQTDPTPTDGDLAHGTAVAGLVAARDLNGLGVRGVAPRACLAGINLIATGSLTSTQEAYAMNYAASSTAVSNNSWGPTDRTGRISTSSSLWQSAIASASGSSGNGGKGVLFAWAAGNGARTEDAGTTGFETDNANYDGYANHYGVVAVCAVNDLGVRLRYSEKGANLWVCGFGETSTYQTNARGLTTTDLTGNIGFNEYSASTSTDTSLATIGSTFFDYRHGSYTRIMNGTSGATPQVAGLVALLAKENPNLTARDIRIILAETARKNDSLDSDWTTNAGAKLGSAGNYNISHKYGFGTVDVASAIALAQTWTNVAAEETVYDSGVVTVNQAFANNDSNGATNAIVVSGNTITKVEFVEVTLSATGDIGDLDVRLTNTAGTVSILAEPHSCWPSSSSTSPSALCSQSYSSWRFGTARHLNENANQTWTLRVSDRRTGTTSSGGTFTSWRLKIHGRAS